MLKSNVVDQGARVGPRQDHGNLDDVAVNNVTTSLVEAVGVDRESLDVAVLHELLGVIRTRSVVERAVGVNTLIPILEQCMPENIVDGVVPMLPYKRHALAVILLERIMLDSAPIGAGQVVLSGPATEVKLHPSPLTWLIGMLSTD